MTSAAPTPLPAERQAEQILRDLGETGGRAYAQTVAILHALGMDVVREILEEVRNVEAGEGLLTTDGARRRTPGGVFLYVARARLPSRERRRIFHPEFGAGTPDLPEDGGSLPSLPATIAGAVTAPRAEPHVEVIRTRPKAAAGAEPLVVPPSIAPPSSGVRPMRRLVRPASSEPSSTTSEALPPPPPVPEITAPVEVAIPPAAEVASPPAETKEPKPRKARKAKAVAPPPVVSAPRPSAPPRPEPSPHDVARAQLAAIDWSPSAGLHLTLRRIVEDFVVAASELYAAEMASLVEQSLTKTQLLPPEPKRGEKKGAKRRR